jgi:alpha-L-fucosidase
MLAETNTSIRAGWFWRDDTEQAVRTPEDVFDIYERAVGGNTVFLLNIPPNRDGLFSPRDVTCLAEVGRMIRGTYGASLASDARATAPAVLDNNPETFWQAAAETGELQIDLPEARTFNRVVLGEATATHSQRVEAHAVDAWVDGRWQEVVSATTVGHRRILRFPAVTTDRVRVRITAGRARPTLAHVSLHLATDVPGSPPPGTATPHNQ